MTDILTGTDGSYSLTWKKLKFCLEDQALINPPVCNLVTVPPCNIKQTTSVKGKKNVYAALSSNTPDVINYITH